MLFNSIEYLFFLPIVLSVFALTPVKFRPLIVFLVSCLFYAAVTPVYLLLIFALIVFNFFIAPKIESTTSNLYWLLTGILGNLLPLFIWKYGFWCLKILGMTTAENTMVFPDTGVWLLPLGLSFHTFQAISYIVEVYKRQQESERSIITFGLYIMFFPQLLAGPIERPRHMLPQLRRLTFGSINDFAQGLFGISLGLFMKCVIADRWSPLVDKIYENISHISFFDSWVGIYGFSWQIYCDFAGYSLIALGTAKLFGIRLIANFERPYLSVNLIHFWRRWHISLSSWFRDYVYIPLGGSNGRSLIVARNVMITFLLSGLWHGANITFLIWGAAHGAAFVLVRFLQRAESVSHVRNFFTWFVTFNFVAVVWVIFRSPTIAEIRAYYHQSFTPDSYPSVLSGLTPELMLVISFTALVFVGELLWNFYGEKIRVKFSAVETVWLASLLFFVTFCFGKFDNAHFIYYRF